jgi:transcriptional regulator with XRE-family HTH domain
MANERRSTPVDAYVGRRLKQQREALSFSQEKLADMLGISFQQVQKYERGLNRVGASRLFQLCGVLGVDAGIFGQKIERPGRGQQCRRRQRIALRLAIGHHRRVHRLQPVKEEAHIHAKHAA